MLLNTCEFFLMNNPVRAMMQRYFEARRFLKMSGSISVGRALEIGCGRGVGVKIILDQFHATTVDAFDLDPRMVQRARKRLKRRREKINLWVGDATHIQKPDSNYDAVFDFGIIHHVPDWRAAVTEVFRVLKPGGLFYAEEVFKKFISHPVWRRLLEHPQQDRFDHQQFISTLTQTGFIIVAERELWKDFGWYVATKP